MSIELSIKQDEKNADNKNDSNLYFDFVKLKLKKALYTTET